MIVVQNTVPGRTVTLPPEAEAVTPVSLSQVPPDSSGTSSDENGSAIGDAPMARAEPLWLGGVMPGVARAAQKAVNSQSSRHQTRRRFWIVMSGMVERVYQSRAMYATTFASVGSRPIRYPGGVLEADASDPSIRKVAATGQTATTGVLVPENAGQRNDQRVPNPLWIISLFLGLSELVVAAVATQVDGWVQGLFAVFSTVFPCGIAVAFFLIVWHRPYVLYAPRDYSEHTTVDAFVSAMTSPGFDQITAIEGATRPAVASVVSQIAPPEMSPEERESVVENAVESVAENFVQRTIRILIPPTSVSPPAEMALLATESTTVHSLLQSIYNQIRDIVPVPSYGSGWWLVNEHGRRVRHIGPAWAMANGKKVDDRRLEAAGIKAGSVYRVKIYDAESTRVFIDSMKKG
jgi:hypothetical protein